MLEELRLVVQVQEGQEGRLDLVLGLGLEVPVVVQEQEVQQEQQELETNVLFELLARPGSCSRRLASSRQGRNHHCAPRPWPASS